ncbi:type III secretion HpaP family protein [Acidovorax sp. BLS4]|uniref:type III secretion HpaP family protein n=1 Tax=Acidovorax sp. BLS4 TaxID=3273430 RepID=UPI002942E423|nr:type III secretion HpaP family protein [Paracidovorax avenae]WOI44531.1 type III secretion HpaP family protein [Paracidovorax avenae]
MTSLQRPDHTLRHVAHPAVAATPALLRPNSQERFRRELFPPALPQDDPAEDEVIESTDPFATAAEGTPPDPMDSSDGEPREQADAQGDSPNEEERDNNAPPAPAPQAATSDPLPPQYFFIQGDTVPPPLARTPAPGEAGQDLPDDRPPVHAVGATGTATDAEPPQWLRDTAQTITDLCLRADPAFQSWAVTVPMDPKVLPECELALGLSSYAMTLRFRTMSSESRHLISKHRDQLHGLLARLGTAHRSIDIDLE